MALLQAPLAYHWRLAYKLKRGNLSLDALPQHLPDSTLENDALGSFLDQAWSTTQTDPAFAVAMARVAWEEARRGESPLWLARAEFRLATCLSHADQWDEALERLQHARQSFAGLGQVVDAACCDQHAAYACRFLAEYDKGELMAARAANVFRLHGLDRWQGRALLERARNLNQLGRLDESDHNIRAARQIFERLGEPVLLAQCDLAEAARLSQSDQHRPAQKLAEGAWLELHRQGRTSAAAWAEYQLGYVACQLNEFDAAIDYLERAARAFSRLDLPQRRAITLNQWGITLIKRGQFTQAQPLLREAAATFQRLQPRGFFSGLVQTNLGNAAMFTGNLAAAEQHFEIARLALARPEWSRWQASVEAGLGYIYRERGQFDRAIFRLDEALRIWRAAGDEYHAATAQEDLAGLYLLLGDSLAGVRLLQACLAYYEATQRPEDAARAQIEMAGAHIANGRPEFALSLLNEAADYAGRAGSVWSGARIELSRGDALAQLQRFGEAETHFGLSAELFGKLHLHSDRSMAVLRRAEIWRLLGNTAGARDLIEGLTVGGPHVSPELVWRYQDLKGRLASEPALALQEYRAAIDALQSGRRTLSREEVSAAYIAGRRQVFETAIELAVGLRRAADALEISEESRAQVLAAQLRRPRRSRSGMQAPESLAEQRRSRARAELRIWQQRLAGRSDTIPGDQLLMGGQDRRWAEYFEASAAAQREASFTLDNPAGWAAFDLNAFCESANDFLPAGWRSLAYHLTDEMLYTFELSAEGVAVHSQNLRKSGLQRLLDEAADPEVNRHAGLVGRNGQALRRRLYDLLIPFSTARRLRPGGWLHILPYGSLNSLPFHALQAPDGQYLVEQSVVAYAPSLLTLELLFSRQASTTRPVRGRAGSLCLVAHTGGPDGQAALPAASREIEALTQVFGQAAFCLQEGKATVAALNELSDAGRLAEFEYLHLLAHGQFDTERSRSSRLMLADGGLLVDDVADLQLQARVVTLSACEAGVREVFAGEEWVGLTQAFLAAGADCVVAGLWGLADESMPWPMRLFYKNLLRGRRPAEALCAAQRSALRVHEAPYLWAAMAAVGL